MWICVYSALYRIQAAQQTSTTEEQKYYNLAVDSAKSAIQEYQQSGIEDIYLKADIYSHLGASLGNNPQGDLEEAHAAYQTALQFFSLVHATESMARIRIQCGALHFMAEEFDCCQAIIQEVRATIRQERLAMDLDMLEAQLCLAIGERGRAISIARQGLTRAEALGAKDNERRFAALLTGV